MAAGTLRAGVDLGGTKIQALVLDDEHRVQGRAREETPREGGPEAVTDAIARALHAALGEAGGEAGDLAGIGVGSPGVVDDATGTVGNARNLPDWIDPYPLAAQLSRQVGEVPVHLGNDVTVAIEAEYALGAGRPFDSVLGVWWGTGVGGGLILNRAPWHGRGFAGEFGHMVVRRGGALCGCGNRGCVEAYAGRKSMEGWVRRRQRKGHQTDLLQIMERHDKDVATSGIWWRAVRDEDRLALRAVDRAVRAIGAGIASAVNLLDLEAVIIGGGMGERFYATHGPRIRQAMHDNLFRSGDPPRMLATELGDDGGAIGASLLAVPQA